MTLTKRFCSLQKNIKVDLMINYLEGEACCLYKYRYILDHGQMASVGTYKNCHLMVNPHISVTSPSDGINFRWYGVGMVWLWSSMRIMAQRNQGISMSTGMNQSVFPGMKKNIWNPFCPTKTQPESATKPTKGTQPVSLHRRKFQEEWLYHTVEGRNPGPVDMVSIPLFTIFFMSQVV